MKCVHTYPARIDAGIYEDLVRIRELDNQSINSLLQEGARKVRDAYVLELAQQRKTRTTLRGAAGWLCAGVFYTCSNPPFATSSWKNKYSINSMTY